MLAFGLRRGEALGLHWSALSWEAGTLKVTHGVKRIGIARTRNCGPNW